MLFTITMPTEDDLVTLPLVDITPDGIWTPSAFKSDPGLSFVDSYFNPPCLAQMVLSTFAQEGEEKGLISNTGEAPSTSNPTDGPSLRSSMMSLI